MSQDEESSTRVTRGALRRRSIDAETTAGSGTPKKPAANKKAVLIAIQESNNAPVDSNVNEESSSTATTAQKDSTLAAGKSVQKVKDESVRPGLRSRSASLTEENLASLEASHELRRTPRRRPSQDVITPKTAPQPGRRITRRNSATSDDASSQSLPSMTPKVSKSRLSVAPPTIAEDDEKEEKANNSQTEADLDVRRLRNRSISNSPVPRSSPTSKNTSITSQKAVEGVTPTKQAEVLLDDVVDKDSIKKAGQTVSPPKEAKILQTELSDQELSQKAPDSSEVVTETQSVSPKKSSEIDVTTPNKSDTSSEQKAVSSGSAHEQLKNVTFDEQTPGRENHSSYPKTPILTTSEKRYKFGERRDLKDADKKDSKSTPDAEEMAETMEVTQQPSQKSDDIQQQEREPIEDAEPSEDPLAEPMPVTQQKAQNSDELQKQEHAEEIAEHMEVTKQPSQKSDDIQQQEQKPVEDAEPSEDSLAAPMPVTQQTAQNSDELQKQEQKPVDDSEPSEETLDQSVDTSLTCIVEEVRENINKADLSMSILGTPKPTEKPKSHFAHLREGASSTPIVAPASAESDTNASITPEKEQQVSPTSKPRHVFGTPDGRGKKRQQDRSGKELKVSKSWSQVVTGSADDKGIDLFSVRKQEEERRKDEEMKKLNESLKRKSLERKQQSVEDDEDEEENEDEDENEDEEDDEDDSSAEKNSLLDDEAMEVDDYESGDSLDTETRQEMEDNEVPVEGESIGSDDSEQSDEEDDEDDDEDDSFIASENEDHELLEGSEAEFEEDIKTSSKKKRKRIIQPEDSSEDEEITSKQEISVISLDKTTESNASKSKSNSSTVSKNESITEHKSPKKTPTGTPSKSPAKTIAAKVNNDKDKSLLDQDKSAESMNDSKAELHSPRKSANGSVTETKSPQKLRAMPSAKSVAKVDHNKDTNKSLLDQDKSNESMNGSKAESDSPRKSKNYSIAETKSPERSRSTPSAKNLAESPEIKSPLSKDKSLTEKESSEKVQDASPKREASKPRKSLPTPVLISADFYVSSTNKRSTINVLADVEEDTPKEQSSKESNKRKSAGLVANPAAIALAKKNKRESQDSAASPSKSERRSSLPSKRSEDKPGESTPKEDEAVEKEAAESMECDEQAIATGVESEETTTQKSVVKKKQTELSEFDHDAILTKCNEIVRADKERKKQTATLRQKKKDEKRRQKEQEEKEEEQAAGGDLSLEQQKKKKKKKKLVNYFLEELGETKEQQLAKALKRKQELLAAKRERKRARKAAKLQSQLNKENQQDEVKEGIGAKFEKKAKKKKALIEQLVEPDEEPPKPQVRPAISAFTVYSAQIEELRDKQNTKKKKNKQLKEKNQHRSAVDEVKAALKSELIPKDSAEVDSSKTASTTDEAKDKHKKKDGHNKETFKAKISDEHVKKIKKHSEETSKESEDPKPKKKKLEHANTAPVMVVCLEDEIMKLKKSISEPITKVVKKQKLSQKHSNAVNFSEEEKTPPRKTTSGKLKALSRLESGFLEEPMTPEHLQLKRNHGFKEEPVTPKPIGFRVSSLLPTGQEELQRQAIEAKKKKHYTNSSRIRTDDVKEPSKGLPLPIWTRSGTFEVEDVNSAAQTKSAEKFKASEQHYIPLNGTGSGKHSTEFLVKPLSSKKSSGKVSSKAHRIDPATMEENIINFKQQAIFGQTVHLREKKPKF